LRKCRRRQRGQHGCHQQALGRKSGHHAFSQQPDSNRKNLNLRRLPLETNLERQSPVNTTIESPQHALGGCNYLFFAPSPTHEARQIVDVTLNERGTTGGGLKKDTRLTVSRADSIQRPKIKIETTETATHSWFIPTKLQARSRAVPLGDLVPLSDPHEPGAQTACLSPGPPGYLLRTAKRGGQILRAASICLRECCENAKLFLY
jgi:hypothetical protein